MGNVSIISLSPKGATRIASPDVAPTEQTPNVSSDARKSLLFQESFLYFVFHSLDQDNDMKNKTSQAWIRCILLVFIFSQITLYADVVESPSEKSHKIENTDTYPIYPFYSQGRWFLALDNGYRWDKISNRVTLGGPTISVKGSTQSLRNINSYQLGARGQFNFCECAFIRGDGHYGWVLDGDYSEGGFFGDTRGHTYDVEGALGYYFSLARGIWIAPIVGWSYDAFLLKGVDITTAINGCVFDLDDIKAHQHFSGPFLGFDLFFQPNDCWEFTFGYEFHYAHWHGQRLIQGPEYGNPPFGWTTGFSNKRHLHRVYGQVFNLDAVFQFWGCWRAGLELKYQFYNGDQGKYRQTRSPLNPLFSYATVNGLWWRSFASTVFVGRMF